MKYTVLATALFAALWCGEAVAQHHVEAGDGWAVSAPIPAAPLLRGSDELLDRSEWTAHPPRSDLWVAETSSTVYQSEISGAKAFVMSLLLPGLGHRHVHGGDWDGWASIFAVADAALWAGLVGSEWRRNHLIESYTTLAATHAGAQTAGKERDFFLYLSGYMSSDDFVEVQLRNRNWGQVGYVDDPAYQWEWISEDQFEEYGRIREGAESLRRRRTFIITSLVANRLISSFTALRAAGRARAAQANASQTELSFGVPPAGATAPLLELRFRF